MMPTEENQTSKEKLGEVSRFPNTGPTQQPGEILLKLKKGSTSLKALQQAESAKPRNFQISLLPDGLDKVLTKYQVKEMKSVFRVANRLMPAHPTTAPASLAPKSGKAREDLFRWYRLSIPTNSDPAEVIVALKKHPDVEIAEPNYLCRLADVGIPDGTTDPDMGSQWHLDVVKA